MLLALEKSYKCMLFTFWLQQSLNSSSWKGSWKERKAVEYAWPVTFGTQ